MKRTLHIRTWLIAICVACPSGAIAQAEGEAEIAARSAASADSAAGTAQIAAGTAIRAALETPLDAARARTGETVKARVTRDVRSEGRVVLSSGSTLVGRITEVRARASGESSSSIGVSFDRARLADGSEIPLALSIQTLASAKARTPERTPTAGARARAATRAEVRARGQRSGGGGGLLGTASGALEGASSTLDGGLEAATDATLDDRAQLDTALSASSSGVIGIEGLTLDSRTSSSLLVQKGRNLSLSSGTRLLLRVEGAAKP